MQKTERRYRIYVNNKMYVADEEDMKKLEENADEMLVKLKQVMVHPPNISAIEPFFVDYIQKTKVIDKDGQKVAVLEEAKPPQPIENLFDNNLLKLTHGKNEIERDGST